MARYLAIDWDDAECRYLFASAQKGTVTVRKAGSAALESARKEEDGIGSPSDELPDLVDAIQNVLKEERIDPSPILVSLGRSKVEMLYQTLPPCLESEIPVLLKNQVLREHSGFSDFDPLDYLRLGNGGEEECKVLAFTIPLSYRQTLIRRLRSIGRTPQRIGFRPVAAAELIVRSDLAPDELEPAILVDVVGRDIDLVLLEGKRIASIRSFRLPESLSYLEIVRRIGEEVERTVTIGFDGLADVPIRKIFLFGGEDDWTPLVDLLISMELEPIVVNPFTIPGIVAPTIPELPGRFAPLLGLLKDQASGRKSGPAMEQIDFLHPKEAPKPANHVRSVLMILFLLLVVGFGLYHWNRGVVRNMEADLAQLEKEYAEVVTQFRQVQPIYNVLRQTYLWDSQGVVWLDELRELSVVLPDEQDLVVSQISFTTGPINNNPRLSGMIQMSGMIRDPSVLMTLRNNLRAKGIYDMSYQAPSVNPAGGGYPWLFRTSIVRIKR